MSSWSVSYTINDIQELEFLLIDFKTNSNFFFNKIQMKDNKFNADGFMAMVKMNTDGDATKMKIAEDVIKDCGDKGDADRCEAGAKICTCLAQSTKARGLAM